MTQRKLRACLFCCALMALLFTPRTWADQLDRLLDLTGLQQQLEATPREFKQGFLPQVQQAFDAATLQEFESLIDRSLASEVMIAHLHDYMVGMREGLSDAEIRALVTWHESDFGRKIVRLETQASKPAAVEKMLGSMETLLVDESRVAVFQAIESHLRLVDYNLALVQVTQGALLDAMVNAAGPSARVDRGAMHAMLNTKLAAIRPDVEYSTLAHLAYSYQDLSLVDLERYLRALQQPEMVRLNQALMAGMADVLEQAFNQFAQRLGARVVELQQVASRS